MAFQPNYTHSTSTHKIHICSNLLMLHKHFLHSHQSTLLYKQLIIFSCLRELIPCVYSAIICGKIVVLDECKLSQNAFSLFEFRCHKVTKLTSHHNNTKATSAKPLVTRTFFIQPKYSSRCYPC